MRTFIFIIALIIPVCISAQEHTHARNEIGIRALPTLRLIIIGDSEYMHIISVLSANTARGHLEAVWSKHDTHFMLGIHCAYGF